VLPLVCLPLLLRCSRLKSPSPLAVDGKHGNGDGGHGASHPADGGGPEDPPAPAGEETSEERNHQEDLNGGLNTGYGLLR
jgi:hypothetical protein